MLLLAPWLSSLGLGLSCCLLLWLEHRCCLFTEPLFSPIYTSPSEKHPLLFFVCSVFPDCMLLLLSITQDRCTIVVVNYSRELQGNTSYLLGIDKLPYINSCWYLWNLRNMVKLQHIWKCWRYYSGLKDFDCGGELFVRVNPILFSQWKEEESLSCLHGKHLTIQLASSSGRIWRKTQESSWACCMNTNVLIKIYLNMSVFCS